MLKSEVSVYISFLNNLKQLFVDVPDLPVSSILKSDWSF